MKNGLLFLFVLGTFVNCHGSDFEDLEDGHKNPCSRLAACVKGCCRNYADLWNEKVIGAFSRAMADFRGTNVVVERSKKRKFGKLSVNTRRASQSPEPLHSRGLNGCQSPTSSPLPSPCRCKIDKKK